MFCRILCIAFCLFFVNSKLVGQRGFDRGYILETPSDTTFGFVKYRFGQSNPLRLEFKTTLESDSRSYSVADIVGFGYSRFEHYEVLDLTEINGITTLYFSKILVKGEKLSLYKIPSGHVLVKGEDDQTPRFVADTNHELDQAVVRTNTRILGALLTDCSEPLFEKANGRFNERSLVKITLAFNQCLNSDSKVLAYNNNAALVKIEPSIHLGFLFSKPQFNASKVTEVREARFRSGRSLTFGLAARISSPRYNESVAFIVGLDYAKVRHYGYIRQEPNLNSLNADIRFELSSIKGFFGLEFSKKIADTFVFAQGGLSVISNSNFTTEMTVDRTRLNQNFQLEIVRSFEEPELVGERNGGVWFGVGMKRSLNDKLGGRISLIYERLLNTNDPFAEFNNIQLSIAIYKR